MKQIHITTGDQDGIGLEISLKSLLDLPVQKNIQYVLWRNTKTPSFLNPLIEKLDHKFHRISKKEFSLPHLQSSLIDIQNDQTPVDWVETVAQLCLENQTSQAMVTAPLSKTLIQETKSSCKGHTDILKQITGCPHVFMCFLGKHFNVVLLTDHIPLKEVKITKELLMNGIDITLKASSLFNQPSKPLGILGLNPHAGEKGILGPEEETIFHLVIKKFQDKIKGPLVPDVAFQPSHWKKYSCYLCTYHDQGLIPFKMIHQNQGVHVTLGIPFIRTSVDHGTAKDLFGQNKASYSSMIQACKKALTLLMEKII